jgi:hypothetical protein
MQGRPKASLRGFSLRGTSLRLSKRKTSKNLFLEDFKLEDFDLEDFNLEDLSSKTCRTTMQGRLFGDANDAFASGTPAQEAPRGAPDQPTGQIMLSVVKK